MSIHPIDALGLHLGRARYALYALDAGQLLDHVQPREEVKHDYLCALEMINIAAGATADASDEYHRLCEADAPRPGPCGPDTPSKSEWRTAHTDYLAKRAYSDSLPDGAPNEDAAVDAYCDAMDHLIEKVPAPTPLEVCIKLDLALKRAEGFEALFDDYVVAIRQDLWRLGCARPEPDNFAPAYAEYQRLRFEAFERAKTDNSDGIFDPMNDAVERVLVTRVSSAGQLAEKIAMILVEWESSVREDRIFEALIADAHHLAGAA